MSLIIDEFSTPDATVIPLKNQNSISMFRFLLKALAMENAEENVSAMVDRRSSIHLGQRRYQMRSERLAQLPNGY